MTELASASKRQSIFLCCYQSHCYLTAVILQNLQLVDFSQSGNVGFRIRNQPLMLTFSIAFCLLILAPGPGVLSTAGVGAAYGYRPGLHYVFGLWVGNNMVSLAVISGLAAALLAVPVLRTVLVIASTAYLLYLASKIAFSGSKIAFITPQKPPGFWDAITLQALNPKAYVVHTTFIGGFSFLADNPTLEIILKVIIMNAIWIPIHLIWLWVGVRINALNLSNEKQRAVNIAMALAMVSVVALAFFYRG